MWYSIILMILLSNYSFTQFTREDSIKGSTTPERAWWDVKHYDLEVEVCPITKSIKGKNTILFNKILDLESHMQIDLQSPMEIDSITTNRSTLSFTRINDNSYYVFHEPSSEERLSHKLYQITIYFHGIPIEAKNAPWDGGIVWGKDDLGNDFIASAIQELGASAWWPCKDHWSDEPDFGAKITLITPSNLTGVSNGRLISNQLINDKRVTVWEVNNPINTYGVNFNVGNYTSWEDIYVGKKGNLKLSFYVLENHLEKAKNHFQEVYRMLEAFEHWFGPYPFYEDGYKLVEVPYLGMEHQSSVTYGNRFLKGYLGTDLSGTGWGLKWDFIIVHESGHEWFANSITAKDPADMWIHESFTCYSESLFTEYFYGKDAAFEYVRGLRKNIQNDEPIIPAYEVNQRGSIDMYYKGANMLHMIRMLVNDDSKWHSLLLDLNKTFYHQTVSSQEIEEFMSNYLGFDLTPIFDQYLRTTNIPVLEIRKQGKYKIYNWSNCTPNFTMPIDVLADGKSIRITSTTTQQKIKAKKIQIDPNYLIYSKKIGK